MREPTSGPINHKSPEPTLNSLAADPGTVPDSREDTKGAGLTSQEETKAYADHSSAKQAAIAMPDAHASVDPEPYLPAADTEIDSPSTEPGPFSEGGQYEHDKVKTETDPVTQVKREGTESNTVNSILNFTKSDNLTIQEKTALSQTYSESEHTNGSDQMKVSFIIVVFFLAVGTYLSLTIQNV